jgi:hypothetical protein
LLLLTNACSTVHPSAKTPRFPKGARALLQLLL